VTAAVVPASDSETDADLVTERGLRLPAAAMTAEFSRSGGPGGQHANVTASRVVLVADLTQLRGPGSQRARAALGDVVRVVAEDSRSQWRNRGLARRRLAERLDDAARPRAVRRPTRATRASVERRLDEKRRQAERKQQRRRPDAE
jgi:ribosome-associated protein